MQGSKGCRRLVQNGYKARYRGSPEAPQEEELKYVPQDKRLRSA